MANATVQDRAGANREEDAVRPILADVKKAALAVEKAAGREEELAEKGETREVYPTRLVVLNRVG